MPLRVDIRCVECILDGSPAVSELRLQERVQFDVHTCFRCQQGMITLVCCPAVTATSFKPQRKLYTGTRILAAAPVLPLN